MCDRRLQMRLALLLLLFACPAVAQTGAPAPTTPAPPNQAGDAAAPPPATVAAPPATAAPPPPATPPAATSTLPPPPPPPPESSSARQRLQPQPPSPPKDSASDPLSKILYGIGLVTAKFNATLYGFAEFDLMYDTTQSFTDSMGNSLILRSDANPLTGNHGRLQMTARNSRIGFKMTSPEWHGVRATGLIEGDFMGNQPSVSEGSFFNNGTFRIRAGYIKLESKYIDILGGQYYAVFGQQPFFFPNSVAFFQIPNQIFGRTTQFRLSHGFKSKWVNFDIVAAILRPPQRDAEIPDVQGALRFSLNAWKGAHSIGSGYAVIDPPTIGISGAWRHFRVNEWSATPMSYRKTTGWGLSVDAMIPVIPARSADDKANALTVTGSFVRGSGDGDLYGLNGGTTFPAVPTMVTAAAAGAGAPVMTVPFNANIDPGMVQYDANGNLRTINWQSFMVGVQYYLPPKGRIFISANYTQANSDNITEGLVDAALGKVFTQSQYVEVNAFADITTAVRTGAAWQRVMQTYGDGARETNDRFMYALYYFF